MKASAFPALTLLTLVVFAACGGSSSSDDDNGAAGGADCASHDDCADPLPKCTLAGECVDEGYCDTDADCRGDFKFCDTFHRCEPCRTDADCPSEAPACVPGWEFGVYCAACRGGDSSTCPAGAVCTPDFSETGGGRCEPPNCASAPDEKPCVACFNEQADVCLGDGDECEGAHGALEACYATEIPGWMSGDCPTGLVPSLRGCTPEACFDEADAFDACLLGCDAALALCELE
jgi:hypothetical protein